jgi:hypothetical protein
MSQFSMGGKILGGSAMSDTFPCLATPACSRALIV